ncbi:MAG: uroporphyrinogen decarboxylase [Chlorobi bacterium]|nr:uroporphyrinogen decarboxylase [Chlorobiota bacterium]
MGNIFLDTLKGKSRERPPVWYMRQAGRVLPSYCSLKAKHSFWEMMRNPELAAKVTMLPVNDLDVDGAILFSDILVIPHALGMGLEFTDAGPVFELSLKKQAPPYTASLKSQPEKLNYIYDVIRETVRIKPADIPLIGFCGGPLTVLCYMIEGLGTRTDFPEVPKFIYKNKREVAKLVDLITELSLTYMEGQINNGIDIFQLFETHAGLVPAEIYFELFMPAVEKLGKYAKEKNIPFIYFPKGLGTGIERITPDICDFISIDWQMPLPDARKLVHPEIGLQGNLDPRVLFAGKEEINFALDKLYEFGQKEYRWIFNLGHGFLPDTPYENARYITNWVKTTNWNRR